MAFQAIEQRDTARLERYVDFPRVRSSLRAQLNDYLVRQAGPTWRLVPSVPCCTGWATSWAVPRWTPW